ncbi:MAG TPA: GH3 auxin-responsive promoter family protein, partial [Planctomycetaceae bacterium]|nr:GH3 auxin-responsive promoter family protein [Planctomycetaceae bacterium]
GVIVTANPGTLVRLAILADQHKEELIRDIFDVTLSPRQEIAPEVRAALAPRIRVRHPGRARELERIVERTGHLYPRDFWASDTLIAVWTGGSCGAYLGQLRRYYGAMPIRDHGLSASEGRMTIPIRDLCPEGILEIETHFFEFIPESEYGRPDPTVLEAHELQEGENYYILLTTSSGFYRYDICDVVQCVGYYQATPLLTFLHKGSHISSITGEKLAESQAVEAVTAALEELELRVEQFTLAPAWGEPPGYRLLIEEQDAPSGAALTQLEKAVDERLQQVNCEYREKRVTGRLVPVQVTLLRTGAWDALFRRRTQRAGGSVEQYKHPCLLPDLQSTEELLRDFSAEPSPQVLSSSPRSVWP